MKFNYHFLPTRGTDITLKEATHLSKYNGIGAVPFYSIRQSPTDGSIKFVVEALKLAQKMNVEFEVGNQISRYAPWWQKNEIYLKWLESKSNKLMKRYSIDERSALVVSQNDRYDVYYNMNDLKKDQNGVV
jgi:hypothetical protein